MAVGNPYQQQGYRDETNLSGVKTGVSGLPHKKSSFQELGKALLNFSHGIERRALRTNKEIYHAEASLMAEQLRAEQNAYLSLIHI